MKSREPVNLNKKLQILDERDMLKRFNSISKSAEIVQYLSEGKFYLFKGADVLDFKEGIDWEYEHSHSQATYQLYLHSLDIIAHLCDQYTATKEVQLLERSLEILNSWIQYDNSLPDDPPIKMWSDHSAACRSLTITFFYMLSRNLLTLDESMIYDCLVKHAHFLYKDSNYSLNNHGIMMDRALISLAIILANHKKSSKWKNKAMSRIEIAFYRDFSKKGTHLENSPDYHFMVMNFFISTEVFLNKNNLTLGKKFENRLELAKKYFQYLAKPDKKRPMLGDSSSSEKVYDEKKYDNFIDTQAGIAILQHLNRDDPNLSTWLSFVCGYGSKAHKHHDDLSFTLFWKGKDIFVDSGKYNYDRNNKYRSYIISPLAHNTITIAGLTYQLGSPKSAKKKITITDFTSNSIYDLVKGKNMNYRGMEVYRTLIFLKPNNVIIYDKVLSKNAIKGLQLFNLAVGTKIIATKEKSVIMESGKDKVEIISLLDIDDIIVYHGDRQTPRAVISQKFAALTDISQIEISKQGTNLEFLTLIKMGESILPEISYDQKNNQLKIKTNTHESSLIL